jgi:hypothetical protein
MFAPGSRYGQVPTAIYVDRVGVQHPYVLLRPFPPAAPARQLYDLQDGERLDLIANMFFADPLQFWRLCDANDELRPEDLERPGERIRIPLVVG